MMYLRITRARFDPAVYDQVIPFTRQVQTALRQLPGVQHVHHGIDRTAGTSATVSVWDTDEHARFARETLGEPISQLQALGVQLEAAEIFEVLDEAGGPS